MKKVILVIFIILLVGYLCTQKEDIQSLCNLPYHTTVEQCSNGDIIIDRGAINYDGTETYLDKNGFFLYSRGGWGAYRESILYKLRKSFNNPIGCDTKELTNKCS
ncbi:hypothetical protein HYT74_00610 [Candidatus Daviesbacteria bacterium]|nr:hypothetical protein [Candidatus Daviesbacteria bacterium]